MLFYLLMQLPDPLVQLPDPHVRLPEPLHGSGNKTFETAAPDLKTNP